ncbi:MAG: hypothetical protein ACQEXJ_20385 [Myxococcota bacterium]
MYVNSLLGALLPPVAAGVMVRLGAGAVGAGGAAVLVALVPVFIHDATTESLLVPMTLWMWMGILAGLDARRTGRRLDHAMAALFLVLAVMSRPEAVALVPLSLGALVLVAPRRAEPAPRSKVVMATWVAALALLALRVVHLRLSVRADIELGGAPVVPDVEFLAGLPGQLLCHNVLFDPSRFPVAGPGTT